MHPDASRDSTTDSSSKTTPIDLGGDADIGEVGSGLGFDTDENAQGEFHSYLQSGYYASPEQFKAAMSYC